MAHLEAQLKEALDMLASTEDAEWRADVKEFLCGHGYVHNERYTGWTEDPVMVKPVAPSDDSG